MTKSMKAVRIHKYGGPEVLTYEDAPHETRIFCANSAVMRS